MHKNNATRTEQGPDGEEIILILGSHRVLLGTSCFEWALNNGKDLTVKVGLGLLWVGETELKVEKPQTCPVGSAWFILAKSVGSVH